MITLPDGFDGSALLAEFWEFAAPFVEIGLIISVGFLIIKTVKKI